MTRFALSFALCLLAPNALAAQMSTSKPAPITSAVKDAGIYHLSSGAWTRGASTAAMAGPEVIYDNTCTVGYYLTMSDNATMLDSGRIPSTSSPTSSGSLTGLRDAYHVNGFSIGYCSFEPHVTDLDLGFVDCYAPCAPPDGLPTPLVSFSLVNLPAGTATGGQGCWNVTVDLSNTTSVFSLSGDCDGNYDNTASNDNFGWTWAQPVPSGGVAGGPLFAGDPLGFYPQSGQVCGGVGAGTTFVGAGAGPGSGIGLVDRIEIGGGASYAGCFWFGGYGAGSNPMAAFYLQLQGEQADLPTDCFSGSPFCFGDGSGSVCPCGNLGAAGEGCLSSSGTGAQLTGSGCPSASLNLFRLSVTGAPAGAYGLLLRGNNQVNGGLGVAAGDGLLCTAGASGRSHIQQADGSGSTTFFHWSSAPLASVANLGASTNFQFWYRNPSGPCSSGFNFSNGWTVTYVP